MNTTDSGGLLRDYAESGSDAAFCELVSRYIDLVYSVAVRRVEGDTQLAEEVSQRVFIDLARKARTLPREILLGGWLHRHTCFVAGTMVRSEQRRRAREKEAVAMNLLHDHSEADWQQLAPFLDQAIDALPDADRQAIVLRFFERRDLRAIGGALGVSEDAAQKRVSRAIEKLRERLTERGMTLSLAALATMLASHAVISAPASLASSVSNAALAAGGAGVLALLLKLATPAAFKTVTVLGLVTAIVALVLSRRESTHNENARVSSKRSSEQAASPFAATDQASSNNQIMALETPAPNPSNLLRLTIVAADSGQPIPHVSVDYRGWEDQKFTKKQMQGLRNGICEVEFPRETTTLLELTTRIDGFADTRLLWRPNRGEPIPASYTLRLARPAAISGRVVDADGQPVADAKVGFNHEEDPIANSFPESHEFAWIEVLTDTDGGWSINRVGPEMIRRLYGSARHSEHVGSGMLFVGQNLEAERQLRAGTHIFQLGRALTIRGVVVDSSGQPIADAQVLVGQRSESGRRETRSAVDGTFAVNGCKPGKNLLSAEADGFAPATMEVEAAPDSEPFRIVLQPGRQLRLRIVDRDGQPIPGANLIFDPPSRAGRAPAKAESQARFNKTVEQNGEVIWSNAPLGDLYFSVFGKGCMELRDAKVAAEESEHTFTMSPVLVVHGSVRDAETGEKIPRFRIVGGWPQNRTGEGDPNARWSGLERHWLNFSGGEFHHTFSEALLGGGPNPGYVLKFEADGYASAVSRLIQPDEVDAEVDALLRKGSNTLITVLLPNSRRAADADVGLPSPGADLELAPARFVRRSSQGGALLRTDAQGQFKLSPDPTIERVFLVHEDGYAERTPSALVKDPVVSLGAWGRLEGRFYRQGKPV
ncbi:MAG TPA: sigma-70 family RNA polymerase sigma factor, partial [Methylomirabilota bacterium]|nr:sigma-70 family RNA polymerase sigma factor [Methylomirabilota bacterium]